VGETLRRESPTAFNWLLGKVLNQPKDCLVRPALRQGAEVDVGQEVDRENDIAASYLGLM
jgi:hypothetical protein